MPEAAVISEVPSHVDQVETFMRHVTDVAALATLYFHIWPLGSLSVTVIFVSPDSVPASEATVKVARLGCNVQCCEGLASKKLAAETSVTAVDLYMLLDVLVGFNHDISYHIADYLLRITDKKDII